ncbi:helix-turn-helix transcriptional regulator [Streptomyces albus subsp. chlorinus]|uniref:helix-turn-helix transcriptional regulator n=1 Tax=Streptomyces albus TaxID=1888 RepID=UPI00156FABD9|nr:helix-turn-helix transcriptional regulator [Streptomyces albus]NSC19895.1 helix-turn-helix transcriptional regulator [Streptomyces albus subsp. chlorinus]
MCQPEWRRARVEAQRLADLARLRRVRDRIDREYAQPLNVEALARGVNMSAGHLSRQFRAAYGESPYAYLMTRRIERAAALLRRGDLSVTEVCFAVGCASLGTFTTRFTELVGMPPGAFRRRAADAQTSNAHRADTHGADTRRAGAREGDASADRADAARTAADADSAVTLEGMPACVAKQVTRPVRKREADVGEKPLA